MAFWQAGDPPPAPATVTLRADAGHQRSDSLCDVDGNDTVSAGLTASVPWRPGDRVSLLVAVDPFEDRFGSGYPVTDASIGAPPSPEAVPATRLCGVAR